MTLTDSDRWTVINALERAARAYESDADNLIGKHTGIRQQFRRQAREARRLAGQLQEAA